MNRTLLVAAAASCALAAGGAAALLTLHPAAGGGVAAPTPTPTTASTPAASTSPADDPRQAADSRLLNAVIQAQNAIDPSARELAAAYARDFGAGPEPRRLARPELHLEGDGAPALAALARLEAALAADPGDDALRAAARRYLAAGRAMIERAREAERYYRSGAFRTDKYERGVALHRPLLDGFRDYLTASSALADEGRRRAEERRARTKARLEAEGRVYRLRALEVVEQARALDDLFLARKELAGASPEALDRALGALAPTVAAIGQLASDEAGARKELGPRADQYAALARAADAYLAQARETVRQAKDRRLGVRAAGTTDPRTELLQRFNDLIAAANRFAD